MSPSTVLPRTDLSDGHDMDDGTPKHLPNGTSTQDESAMADRSITILYATETGNAEEVAERLAHIACRRHIHVRLCNLADYDKVRVCTDPDELDPRVPCLVCRVDYGQRRISILGASVLALLASLLSSRHDLVRSDLCRFWARRLDLFPLLLGRAHAPEEVAAARRRAMARGGRGRRPALPWVGLPH